MAAQGKLLATYTVHKDSWMQMAAQGQLLAAQGQMIASHAGG